MMDCAHARRIYLQERHGNSVQAWVRRVRQLPDIPRYAITVKAAAGRACRLKRKRGIPMPTGSPSALWATIFEIEPGLFQAIYSNTGSEVDESELPSYQTGAGIA